MICSRCSTCVSSQYKLCNTLYCMYTLALVPKGPGWLTSFFFALFLSAWAVLLQRWGSVRCLRAVLLTGYQFKSFLHPFFLHSPFLCSPFIHSSYFSLVEEPSLHGSFVFSFAGILPGCTAPALKGGWLIGAGLTVAGILQETPTSHGGWLSGGLCSLLFLDAGIKCINYEYIYNHVLSSTDGRARSFDLPSTFLDAIINTYKRIS